MPRPPGTVLTERDRRLLGYFALARHLTAEQVHLLLGPAQSDERTYKQLRRLCQPASGEDGTPLLRRQEVAPRKGTALGFWRLTDRGWAEAAKELPFAVSRPHTTPGQQHLLHQMQLNQVLVDLTSQLGGSNVPAVATLPFRWVPEAPAALSFKLQNRHGLYNRAAVKPDALVEVPTGGRRFFLEAETGSQSITTGQHDRVHSGSIKQKLLRYAAFFTGVETENLQTTWYKQAFSDELFPELLFVVHSRERKERVAWIVSRRVAKLPEPRPFAVRVLALDEAAAAIAAITAAKPIARKRLVTVPEASAFAIRDQVNDLVLSFNRVLELVHAHNKAPKAEKIALPPLPTETLQKLKTLIRDDLLGTPSTAPRWKDHLIEKTHEGSR